MHSAMARLRVHFFLSRLSGESICKSRQWEDSSNLTKLNDDSHSNSISIIQGEYRSDYIKLFPFGSRVAGVYTIISHIFDEFNEFSILVEDVNNKYPERSNRGVS